MMLNIFSCINCHLYFSIWEVYSSQMHFFGLGFCILGAWYFSILYMIYLGVLCCRKSCLRSFPNFWFFCSLCCIVILIYKNFLIRPDSSYWFWHIFPIQYHFCSWILSLNLCLPDFYLFFLPEHFVFLFWYLHLWCILPLSFMHGDRHGSSSSFHYM